MPGPDVPNSSGVDVTGGTLELASNGTSQRVIKTTSVAVSGMGEIDLRDQAAVNRWFAAKRPQVVFLAAAKVGGIVANNTLRAEFLYDNLAIAANVIHSAHVNGAEKLMFLGSS